MSNLKGEALSQTAHYQLGVKTVGPLLAAYVSWILEEASQRKLTRLYFVARDGQILWEIAKRLQTARDRKLELRYLYGSRQAWHLPAITGLNEAVWDWLLAPAPVLTVERIAKRLGFNPAVFEELLQKHTETQWGLQQELGGREVLCLQTALKSKAMEKAICAQAEKFRVGATAYFKQEGLLTDERWAMVDVGWHGRMQDSLQKILQLAGYERAVPGFYFGLHNYRETSLCDRQAFFFHPNSPLTDRMLGRRLASFLEIFTAADHGSTLQYGFSKEKQSWEPLLEEKKEQAVLQWGLEAMRQGIFAYLEDLAPPLRLPAKTVLNEDMERFITRPTRQEAEVIGSFPFCSDQLGEYAAEFAAPLGMVQGGRYLVALFCKKEESLTYWLEGSAARSQFNVQPILKLAIFLKAIKNHLKWIAVRLQD